MLGLNDPDDPFQRPPFDMLLGWEDEIPTEQDDIADFVQKLTPSAVHNMGVTMAQQAGQQLALPKEVMTAMGIAFGSKMTDLLTDYGRQLHGG